MMINSFLQLLFNSQESRPAFVGLFNYTSARLYIKAGATCGAETLAVFPAQRLAGEFGVNRSGDNTGQFHLLLARRKNQDLLLIGIQGRWYLGNQPHLKSTLHGAGGITKAAVTGEPEIGPHQAVQKEIFPLLVNRELHLNRRIWIPQIIDADVKKSYSK